MLFPLDLSSRSDTFALSHSNSSKCAAWASTNELNDDVYYPMEVSTFANLSPRSCSSWRNCCTHSFRSAFSEDLREISILLSVMSKIGCPIVGKASIGLVVAWIESNGDACVGTSSIPASCSCRDSLQGFVLSGLLVEEEEENEDLPLSGFPTCQIVEATMLLLRALTPAPCGWFGHGPPRFCWSLEPAG